MIRQFGPEYAGNAFDPAVDARCKALVARTAGLGWSNRDAVLLHGSEQDRLILRLAVKVVGQVCGRTDINVVALTKDRDLYGIEFFHGVGKQRRRARLYLRDDGAHLIPAMVEDHLPDPTAKAA